MKLFEQTFTWSTQVEMVDMSKKRPRWKASWRHQCEGSESKRTRHQPLLDGEFPLGCGRCFSLRKNTNPVFFIPSSFHLILSDTQKWMILSAHMTSWMTTTTWNCMNFVGNHYIIVKIHMNVSATNACLTFSYNSRRH